MPNKPLTEEACDLSLILYRTTLLQKTAASSGEASLQTAKAGLKAAEVNQQFQKNTLALAESIQLYIDADLLKKGSKRDKKKAKARAGLVTALEATKELEVQTDASKANADQAVAAAMVVEAEAKAPG